MTEGSSARLLGRMLLVPIWLVVVAQLTVVVARIVAFDRVQVFMLVDAFTPWIYLPAYAIAVAAVCFRFRALTIAAGVIVVAHLALVVPPAFESVAVPAAAAAAPRFRVVTANLEFTNLNHALVREIADFDADVVVLEEVTPAWWQALEAGGLLSAYPHHVEAARWGAGGMALLSRRPLRRVHIHDVDEFPGITAAVTIDGTAVQVLGLHPVAPLNSFARHQRQQRAITAAVRQLPRPRIIAGDFNATMYNRWMVQLEDLGLREAHEAVGRPFAATWPNGEQLLPPLRIDHVLADPELVPLRAAEGRGQGSDHRPVVVDFAIL